MADNIHEVEERGREILKVKDMTSGQYLDYVSQDKIRGDELCVYYLAKMLNVHICVILKRGIWCTSSVKDMDQCRIILAFFGENIFRDTVAGLQEPTTDRPRRLKKERLRKGSATALILQIPPLRSSQPPRTVKTHATDKGTLSATHYGIGKRSVRAQVKCTSCTQSFASHRLRNEHMRSVHLSLHACVQCNKYFKSAEYLKKHVLIYHDKQGRPFKCDKCNKRFAFSSELKEHLSTHSTLRPFKCPAGGCKKDYKRKGDLNKHFQQDHCETVSLQCDDCPLTFRSQKLLNLHGRTHRAPALKCNQCDQVFKHHAQLRRHVKREHK